MFVIIIFCFPDVRQSSNAEKGFMMLKEGESEEWSRKFFVFDDFELKYADLPTSPESEFKRIDLDQVVNLCTDVSYFRIHDQTSL